MDLAPADTRANAFGRLGSQPIMLTAATVVILIGSITSMAIWRTVTGAAPEPDRMETSRQLQARTAQFSEQLTEKTKGLEATQQESIDQLQLVQDQLQTVRRLLAAQQADTRRLSEQVANLTEAVDGLRQSHASTQATESETPSVTRHRPVRHRFHASRRGRSRS